MSKTDLNVLIVVQIYRSYSAQDLTFQKTEKRNKEGIKKKEKFK